jgi:GDP-D-mannose dehydratase
LTPGHELLERTSDLTHLQWRSFVLVHARLVGQAMGYYCDITDSTNLIQIIQQVQPDEISNLGAQIYVADSYCFPEA